MRRTHSAYRVSSSSGHSIEAWPHRGPPRCADRVAKAISDGLALVETERGTLRIHSACVLTRFTSWHRYCEKPRASLRRPCRRAEDGARSNFQTIEEQQSVREPSSTFHQRLKRKRQANPRVVQVRFASARAIAIHCTCTLCMALCHALLFACTPLSTRNAFTMIFTS